MVPQLQLRGRQELPRTVATKLAALPVSRHGCGLQAGTYCTASSTHSPDPKSPVAVVIRSSLRRRPAKEPARLGRSIAWRKRKRVKNKPPAMGIASQHKKPSATAPV